jgi:diaminopimelate decarboxylase
VERALAAGVPPERIVFAGVAKTDPEIRLALRAGIRQFNVESVEELARISAVAVELGRVAPVALRVNPDIGGGGHDKITTGRKGDKFGIAMDDIGEAVAAARRLPGVEPVGLHVHIGSQITSLETFAAAYQRLAELYRALREEGVVLRRLDLGGGLGVRYGDETAVDPVAYAAIVRRTLGDLGCELILEPGRWLVAEAGCLVAAVVDRKAGERDFLVLDTGMNALIRPALYEARHPVLPVARPPAMDRLLPYDVVGPICESSDLFGRDYALPPLASGDLVAIMAAGAYGAVMASDYNSRPSPAEVLVDGGRWAVIRPRRLPAEQMADESIPPWLGPARAAPDRGADPPIAETSAA